MTGTAAAADVVAIVCRLRRGKAAVQWPPSSVGPLLRALDPFVVTPAAARVSSLSVIRLACAHEQIAVIPSSTPQIVFSLRRFFESAVLCDFVSDVLRTMLRVLTEALTPSLLRNTQIDLTVVWNGTVLDAYRAMLPLSDTALERLSLRRHATDDATAAIVRSALTTFRSRAGYTGMAGTPWNEVATFARRRLPVVAPTSIRETLEVSDQADGGHNVQVLYATDRASIGPADNVRYEPSRTDTVTFGTALVKVPTDRQRGTFDPNLTKVLFALTPPPEIQLKNARRLQPQEFISTLRTRVRATTNHQAFAFVHGYNVTFEAAARRIAQLHIDLAFAGVPLVYSWASRAAYTGYNRDSATIDAARYGVLEFLTQVGEVPELKEMHLLAHSMGNRAVVRALELLSVDAAIKRPPLGQLFLAAPDIDAQELRNAALRVRRATRRITLYGSARDKALKLSRRRHGAPRAGDGGDRLLHVDGIDSIDATRVDTDFLAHSYAMETTALLDDMQELLLRNAPPAERPRIRARQSGGGWEFDVSSSAASSSGRSATMR